jgi:hypothetical protein
LEQFAFQIYQESGHIGPSSLARCCAFCRGEKVGEADDLRPKAAHSLHVLLAAVLRHPPTIRPISSNRSAANAASFACRVGMGTHAAVREAQKGARRFAYVLKCDVQKYFASIDHEMLKKLLGRVVKCAQTLDLAVRIIDGYNTQEDRGLFPRR